MDPMTLMTRVQILCEHCPCVLEIDPTEHAPEVGRRLRLTFGARCVLHARCPICEGLVLAKIDEFVGRWLSHHLECHAK